MTFVLLPVWIVAFFHHKSKAEISGIKRLETRQKIASGMNPEKTPDRAPSPVLESAAGGA